MNGVNGTEETLQGTGARGVRRKRTGKKRAHFKRVPKMPVGVRKLWAAASPEEQEQAHKTCTLLLEYWLGRTSKDKLAQDLGVPTIRVWQLSQQAVAGMVAGLLKQPKAQRGRPRAVEEDPLGEKRELRAENADLQRRLRVAEDLIMLLREMPVHRGRKEETSPPSTQETPSLPARKSRPTQGRAAATGSGSDDARGTNRAG